MEFEVLGRLGARNGVTEIKLGTFKQRSLLALLLIRANEVVATDRIVEELWGDDAPDRQKALWVHVSGLRSALEPTRERRSEGTLLRTRPPGYLLQVGAKDLDAWRFEAAVHEGRRLLDREPAAAAAVVGEGLSLWRGRPYDDVGYESFAQAEIARLEELRLEAVELRIEADLRRGLATALVGELESLVRQHPLREGFTAQLMVALYRSGRQADALRAYGRLERDLGEEIGLPPSAGLRQLEERIILGDPSLELGPRTGRVGPVTGLAIRGYELRAPIGESETGVTYRAYQPVVGREVVIKVVRPALANDPAFIRRFESDAELVARLEHPNIVPLYDYWREPDGAYLVMPFLRGGSLAERAAGAPMELGPAARIVDDIGAALAAAHRQGVVHGDVKPSNILSDESGRAYLSDFEISADDPVRGSTCDIHGLGVVLGFALTGREPASTELAWLDLPSGIAEVIERATSSDPDCQFRAVDDLVAAVKAASGPDSSESAVLAHTGVVVNPYKGLRAFEEPDAADFFGRERLVERLVVRLTTAGTIGRFVAVVGPSGAGKSSVVGAGLLPALRGGACPGSADWFVAVMTPGRHPFEELEAGLLRIAVQPPVGLLDELGGKDGIGRALRRVLPQDGSDLVLVVDQFEELFTQAPAATATAFLDALAEAVDAPDSRLRVVVTLRADFYDRPLGHRRIGELLRLGTEAITPMSSDEIERAVAGPAGRVGVTFEPALVARIVADVADRPAALPLLQYALTELFELRRDRVIGLAAYHHVGGLTAALIRRAESLYAGFEPVDQETTRQVLLRLVTLGDDAQRVRRRVRREELSGLGDRSVDVVLDTFGRHRLISFDRDPVTRGPTVEIAHEALLTEWDRLRNWIDEARDDLRQQRRVASAAREWDEAGRHDDYLLRGAPLAALANWAAGTDISLDATERAYIGAAVALDARDRDVERRRVRDLARVNRRLRGLLVGVAVLLVAALIAGGLALRQADRADTAADAADARRVSAQALATESIDRSLLLAAAAVGLDDSPGTRSNLLTALGRSPQLVGSIRGEGSVFYRTDARADGQVLAIEGGGFYGLDVSPDGATVAIYDDARGILAYDTESGRLTASHNPLSEGSETSARSRASPLAFSPDGRYVVIGVPPLVVPESGPRGQPPVRLLDTATLDEAPTQLGGLPQPPVLAVDVDYSRDGRFLAVSFDRYHVRGTLPYSSWVVESAMAAVWDLAAPGQPVVAIELPAPYNGVALSPDGSRLYIGTADTGAGPAVTMYDVRSGRSMGTIAGAGTPLALSPDAAVLAATAGTDVVLVATATGQVTAHLRDHTEPVNAVRFSHDGRLLASASDDRIVDVWDTATGERLERLRGHTDEVWGLGFSPDDRTLFTTGIDRTILSWDLLGDRQFLPRITVDRPVAVGNGLVAASPTGEAVAYSWIEYGPDGVLDGLLQFVDAETGRAGSIIDTRHLSIHAMAWRPDGGAVATTGQDGFVRVWDWPDGRLRSERLLGRGAIYGLDYSEDGARLVVGSSGGLVESLDAESLESDGPVTRIESGIAVLVASPDDRTAVAITSSTPVSASLNESVTSTRASDQVTLVDVVEGRVVRDGELSFSAESADFSADGSRVALGGREGQVAVLDAATGNPVRSPVAAHDHLVLDVDFPAAGEGLVSAGFDGRVALWDGSTGELLGTVLPEGSAPATAAFLPDGETVLITAWNGAITRWNTDPASWVDVACSIAGRDLTMDEWRDAFDDRPYRETCPQ